MKLLSVTLCGMLLMGGSLFAAKKNGLMYDVGKPFVGAQIGVGGVGSVNITAIGGYQYYFQESWQVIEGMRHGVRGIAQAGWFLNKINSFFLEVGADWTIDFNPKDRRVWGAYAGLGFGWYPDGWMIRDFNVSPHIGGSLTIDNLHRFELQLGWSSILAFRYAYMF